MTRDQVLEDIRSTLGIVPEEYNMVPDDLLEHVWLFDKMIQFRDTRIPLKYKQLIGLAVAAVEGNRRLSFVHRELAKHFGATDQEIIETLLVARRNAGGSAFITGAGIDLDQFRNEMKEEINYLRQRKAA